MHKETADTLTPGDLNNLNPNAPESQRRRMQKIKSKLRAAADTQERDDFLTAADLEENLEWDRAIINATIEKRCRESKAMFGTPERGWQMDGDRLIPSLKL
jgi:hypothetical protein